MSFDDRIEVLNAGAVETSVFGTVSSIQTLVRVSPLALVRLWALVDVRWPDLAGQDDWQ